MTSRRETNRYRQAANWLRRVLDALEPSLGLGALCMKKS
jgi:hypothetical protein